MAKSPGPRLNDCLRKDGLQSAISQSLGRGEEHGAAVLQGGWQALAGCVQDEKPSAGARGPADRAANWAAGSASKPRERGQDTTHCSHQHTQDQNATDRHAQTWAAVQGQAPGPSVGTWACSLCSGGELANGWVILLKTTTH